MSLEGRHLEAYGVSFLQSFEAIRRALQLYPSTHPKVTEQLDRFAHNLEAVHRDLDSATFNVIGGEFYINGLPLRRLSIAYSGPLADWEALGMGLVRFDRRATREELLRLFEILARNPEDIRREGGLVALLQAARIESVRVTGVAADLDADLLSIFDQPSLAGEDASRSDVARGRFQEASAMLAALVESAARAKTQGAARLLRTVAARLEARLTRREPVAELLTRLREHHEPSWRHALDGAAIAVLLGRALGLDPGRMELLGEAVALRDVGKLALSPGLLDAPDAAAAREEYERHPVEGARLLLRTPGIDPSAAIVALEHHAGFDGRGFPALRGHGLHPFSRLAAVAAAYDRLAGDRAGAARVEPAEALQRLVRAAGAAFDPAAVRALVSLVGLVPPGSGVRLKDGSTGVVVRPGERSWAAPVVAVLADGEGRALEPVVLREERATGASATIVATFAAGREQAERLKPLL